MLRSSWLVCAGCVLSVMLETAAAQEPIAAPARPAEVVIVAPAESEVAHQESLFAANLLLGYLTGIRTELTLWRGEDRSVAAEAFYGAVATRMGGAEGAGLGTRAFFRRSSKYSTNSLLLGPGLDVFAQFNDRKLVLVAPTIDVSWLHGFVGSSGWETGLNVGFGIGVSSKAEDRYGRQEDNASGKITPLISFYTGLRY